MYSKAESAQIKTTFWTSFGLYMKPVLNAHGEKINWVNYKTGKKNFFLKMSVDKKEAKVCIEIHNNNEEEREALFNQLLIFKDDFEALVGKDFLWLQNTFDDFDKPISLIIKTLPNVSVFKQEDWSPIISFFKENMIKLDAFWQSNKDFIIS